MPNYETPGTRFRTAVAAENPLQIVGTINPYCAVLAAHAGHKALYLSGSGVATASHGLPDLGITDLHDVLEDARRITAATALVAWRASQLRRYALKEYDKTS